MVMVLEGLEEPVAGTRPHPPMSTRLASRAKIERSFTIGILGPRLPLHRAYRPVSIGTFEVGVVDLATEIGWMLFHRTSVNNTGDFGSRYGKAPAGDVFARGFAVDSPNSAKTSSNAALTLPDCLS